MNGEQFEAAIASLIGVGHTKGLKAGEAAEVYLAAAIRISRSCGLGTVDEFKEAVDIMWMSNGARVIRMGGS